LSQDASEELIVSDEVPDAHTGAVHIYLQQRISGIDVFNGVMNVSVAGDGSVMCVGNRLAKGSDKAAKTRAATLSPAQAVQWAAMHLGLSPPKSLDPIETPGGSEQKIVFSDAGISREPIPVRLVYQPVDDKNLRLAWEVKIFEREADHFWNLRVDAETGKVIGQDDYIDEAAYEVFAIPKQSPDAGGRTVELNPAHTTASPDGWHDTGSPGGEYTITRGNNVHAYADRDASNSPDTDSEPDGGTLLDFTGTVVPLDLGQEPDQYIHAAVTNLFYWNNVIHDVFYLYGFNEAAGNFQENNYDRDGVGGDGVLAEAQDARDATTPKFNNANFATPPDGSNPRMQMYVWNKTDPERDGDLDNGIIIHEYGHGITNRMTGGPTNVGCLDNREQMGEGWSDWFALVLTAEESDTPTTCRYIATYSLGEEEGGHDCAPIGGPGIRPAPYTTDMAFNDYTYGDIGGLVIPHGVGFVWATMLWDLYWALVDAHELNFNPDIYDDWDLGGNNLALQLVMDALKLQPCSPGFVDGRDAILLADEQLTGGGNQCIIWEAFAKRGLGYSANQGSPFSTTDGTEAFDIPLSCDFLGVTPESRNVCAGQDAVYEITVGQAFTPSVFMSGEVSPEGPTVSFDPVEVPGVPGTTTMTVDTTGATPGSYTITISGMGSGGTGADLPVELNVYTSIPGTVTLLSPADGADPVPARPTLSWTAATFAASYVVEVDDDTDFAGIDYSETTSETQLTIGLQPLTAYYWRVRAVNPCGSGTDSTVFSFVTDNTLCNFPDLPIPDNTPEGVTDNFIVAPGPHVIMDLDIHVEITHTWVGDLIVTLEHVDTGTRVTLMDRPGKPVSYNGCSSDDVAATLDDEAGSPVEDACASTTPAISGLFIPNEPLSAFDGEDIAGEWSLTVSDEAGLDVGVLVQWCFMPAVSEAGYLSVTPTEGLTASGEQGGPFSPGSAAYTLENTGSALINWTASKSQDWVTLSSTGGVLAPSESTTVTVSINANADALAPNTYGDTVSFQNTDNGAGDTTRPVVLTVNSSGACPNKPVRNGAVEYDALQGAYGAASDGDTLKAREYEFTEDLLFDDDKHVMIEGGYDCDYATQAGYTTISGSLTISMGTITVENLIVKDPGP